MATTSPHPTVDLATHSPRRQRLTKYSVGAVGKPDLRNGGALGGAFLWLTAFYFVYCARPQEVIPGLGNLPVAKVTGMCALISLLLSAGRAPRKLSDLPREAYYLLILIGVLFASALLSPVWRGGAFFATLDFSKVCVLWVLAFLLITTPERLRRIIFIQAASVAMISMVALIKGHSVERLNAVVGGIYSNPNDLAFAIVLSFPFCLAFLLITKRPLVKLAWCIAMLAMGAALMLTASRAGFIDLLITGSVCLWHFGVKGKRFYLIVVAVLLGSFMLVVAGGTLTKRFLAISGDTDSAVEDSAKGSYEDRKLLITKAVEAIAHYPILGVGATNFVIYSDMWLEVHMSYLQIAAEGGVPALILYVLFFRRGFVNLRDLRRRKTDPDTNLLAGALHGSLIGFVVGAAFSPEAYQYFPYLAVCYSSVLVAMTLPGDVPVEKSRVSPWRRLERRGLAQQTTKALTPLR